MNDPTTDTAPAGLAGQHGTLRRTATLAAVAGCVVVATAGCSASLSYNYRTFQSALDRGASCSELFDQRERFSDPETLAKVDRDLAGIGCTSRDAIRDDR